MYCIICTNLFCVLGRHLLNGLGMQTHNAADSGAGGEQIAGFAKTLHHGGQALLRVQNTKRGV